MKSKFTVLNHNVREKILNQLSQAIIDAMKKEEQLTSQIKECQETRCLLQLLNTIVCDHTKDGIAPGNFPGKLPK